MDRFANSSVADQKNLAEKATNENTTKSTNLWLRVYQSWAAVRGFGKNVEEVFPDDLNQILKKFYAEIRKKDGSNYEPDSLRVMQAALHRHLISKRYPADILNDIEFRESRAVLEGKARELRAAGMGKKPNARDHLTPEEEEVLWKSKKLGAHDPITLQHTMWYYLTIHLGLRGCQEHTTMRVEDFVEKVSRDGVPFIEFQEDPTKTRGGGLKCKQRTTKTKMFASGGSRCPVKLFRLYLSKRDAEFEKKGRFYLKPVSDGRINSATSGVL